MEASAIPAPGTVERARILLVDDHPSFCQGLALLCEREPDLEVVACAWTADEAISLIDRLVVDLVVIDVLLAGTDGVELARSLCARGPMRIVGLSVIDEPMRIAQMLRAGASGFALKTQPVSEILTAMRDALAGTRYLAPSIREAVEPLIIGAGQLPLERLTQREREIFDLLARGLSNEAIAGQLHIAPRTVDTHRHNLMKKLDTHSIGQLVRLAAKWGAIP